jgi:hypothetical protein
VAVSRSVGVGGVAGWEAIDEVTIGVTAALKLAAWSHGTTAGNWTCGSAKPIVARPQRRVVPAETQRDIETRARRRRTALGWRLAESLVRKLANINANANANVHNLTAASSSAGTGASTLRLTALDGRSTDTCLPRRVLQ